MSQKINVESTLRELDELRNVRDSKAILGRDFLCQFAETFVEKASEWIEDINTILEKMEADENLRKIRRTDWFSILGTKFNLSFSGNPAIGYLDVRYALGDRVSSMNQVYLWGSTLLGETSSATKKAVLDNPEKDYIFIGLYNKVQESNITPFALAYQMSEEIYEHYADHILKTIELNKKRM